jgi:hypothetical protein
MLEAEGGTAADADMEPGGWIGSHQIHAVNRSPVTKRVVSVKLMAPKRWYHGEGAAPLTLQSFNVERLPEGAYRAPTDEERAAFATQKAERKATAKATAPKAPPLVNPTDADAERLQALWNERVKAEHARSKHYGEYPVSSVLRMTQVQYSERSKGAYGSCETSDVSELLTVRKPYHGERSRETVFKVRTTHGANYAARRVIILTDKPQKPIPWGDVEEARAKQPSEESVFATLGELVGILQSYERRNSPEGQRLLTDANYVGWAYSASMSQQGLTEAGIEALNRFRATERPELVTAGQAKQAELFV